MKIYLGTEKGEETGKRGLYPGSREGRAIRDWFDVLGVKKKLLGKAKKINLQMQTKEEKENVGKGEKTLGTGYEEETSTPRQKKKKKKE